MVAEKPGFLPDLTKAFVELHTRQNISTLDFIDACGKVTPVFDHIGARRSGRVGELQVASIGCPWSHRRPLVHTAQEQKQGQRRAARGIEVGCAGRPRWSNI